MLLRPVDGPGWPRDYLLARIRGAQAQADAAAGDPWPALLAAGRRLYPRFDPAWRREFAPLVGLLEIRALATALRLQQSGDSDRAAAPLHGSLLHPALLNTVSRAPERLPGLLQLPEGTGIRTLEEVLFDRELSHGRADCREPALQLLLQRLIDLRNLLAILKQLRWEGAAAPVFLSGGEVSAPRWRRVWRQQSLSELQLLVERLAPGTVGELPTRLLADLERRLIRRGRDPLDAAVVLRYGWRLRLPTDVAGRTA